MSYILGAKKKYITEEEKKPKPVGKDFKYHKSDEDMLIDPNWTNADNVSSSYIKEHYIIVKKGIQGIYFKSTPTSIVRITQWLEGHFDRNTFKKEALDRRYDEGSDYFKFIVLEI